MLKNNKHRKTLISDYLCLMLCAFTIFMLLFSMTTLTEEPYDGSTVFAVAEETECMETDLPHDTSIEPKCTDLVYNLPSENINGKAVKA